jgi:thioesterase domain-containing protein
LLFDYPDLQWQLRHADLRELVEEMHTRIRSRMGRRPFVLAGVSLGAIVAALVVQFDRELRTVRIVGLDPAGSRPSRRRSRWLAGNLARARRGGLSKLPSFLWLRFNRSVARFLVPRLRGKSRIATLAARLILRVESGLFGRQLRMLLLIDTAARWRRDHITVPSSVPCRIFHTSSEELDVDFWETHFDSVDYVDIEGDHDTWIDFNGPRLLIEEWDAALAQAVPNQAIQG